MYGMAEVVVLVAYMCSVVLFIPRKTAPGT